MYWLSCKGVTKLYHQHEDGTWRWWNPWVDQWLVIMDLLDYGIEDGIMNFTCCSDLMGIIEHLQRGTDDGGFLPSLCLGI
jgi:hypothetical protein